MIKRDDEMEKFMEIIREKWEPEKGNEHRYRHFFFSFFTMVWLERKNSSPV